jgi:hypothetical protein
VTPTAGQIARTIAEKTVKWGVRCDLSLIITSQRVLSHLFLTQTVSLLAGTVVAASTAMSAQIRGETDNINYGNLRKPHKLFAFS